VTGLQVAAEAYFELQMRTLYELKGMFSREEIMAICDNMNGSMISPEFASSSDMLMSYLQDGDKYDGLFRKWGIDGDDFLKRITALTSAQTWFLMDAVRRYWDQDSAKENSLIEFAEKFQI
jgi:hypothetical protein